jgi:type IV pilus assembly protein PilE
VGNAVLPTFFLNNMPPKINTEKIMKQTQRGFTLIELMITVAIIGILASIAYPSYQDSVMKSRRADVKGVLLGLANAMERRFTEANSYCDAGGADGADSCGVAGTNDTGTPSIYAIPAETQSFYTVTINAATLGSYTLSAEPTGAQTNDTCGTLTITQTGAKSPSTAGCW